MSRSLLQQRSINGNDIPGPIVLDGDVTVEGTLGVTGATTLSSTLAVTGATTLSSTLGVTGATTLSGAATLSGATTVTGALTATTGVNKILIPGVYADDAAAAAAGIGVGSIYRQAAGVLAWRQV